MSTVLRVEESEFNSTEILDDNAIEEIEKEVNNLIDLLDDDDDDNKMEETSNLTAIRYPGLTLKSTKRDHENMGILFNISIKLLTRLCYSTIYNKVFIFI